MHLLMCFCGNDATYLATYVATFNRKEDTEYVCSTCASHIRQDSSANENVYVLPIMKERS